jgi:hypothetical protein
METQFFGDIRNKSGYDRIRQDTTGGTLTKTLPQERQAQQEQPYLNRTTKSIFSGFCPVSKNKKTPTMKNPPNPSILGIFGML